MPGFPKTRASGHVTVSNRVATADHPRGASEDDDALRTQENAIISNVLSTVDTGTLMTSIEWVETLSEPGISLDVMRRAAGQLDKGTYNDLLQERYSLELCPYPPCSNPPTPRYDWDAEAAPTRFSLRSHRLKTVRSSDRGPYCSAQCLSRSDWFRSLVGTDRRDLLEDIEDRRQKVAQSARQIQLENQLAAASHPPTTATAPSTVNESAQQSTDTSAPNSTDTTTHLMSTLQIHEKIPTQTPQAPVTEHVDFERPAFRPPTTRRRVVSRGPPSARELRVSQPQEGLHGLPPPQWLSDPRMVEDGNFVEWNLDDELTEEERIIEQSLITDAIRLRDSLREQGELD